jgi:hypothetical protein
METPSVSELAARYPMSDVAVLRRAGLVQKRPGGREQLVSTNQARLKRAGELLDPLRIQLAPAHGPPRSPARAGGKLLVPLTTVIKDL